MRLIDKKFKNNPEKYIYQSLFATLFIFIVLYFIDIIKHSAIIASMGASAFIVFTLPKQEISNPKLILGGYFVGILVGISCFYIGCNVLEDTNLIITQKIPRALLASISVGITLFIMVVTNTEHPPAAGIALGLVFNPWNKFTIIYIFSSVIILVLVKSIFNKFMIDLL